jgi:hypothetical protein
VVSLAKQRGYKFKGSDTTTGHVTFYVIVPANSTGLGVDTRYIPILKKNSIVGSTAGASFILVDDVRFDHPSNFVVAARTSDTTGLPTHYAIKSSGKVISGIYNTETVTVGAFERFRKDKNTGFQYCRNNQRYGLRRQ